MSNNAQSIDVDEQRQEIIRDMIAEHGPNWYERFAPGTTGCHELLDRTALAAETVDRYVLSHPACAQRPEWYALAEQAVTVLNELYQRIGAEHLSTGNNGSCDS